VSGLLQLQSSYFELPEVKTAFKDSQNRIRGMALIHEMLYKSNDFTSIDFRLYIRSLVLNIQRTYKIPCQVTINYDIESINLNLITAIPCGLIINEAISNSYKHAFQGRKRGVISISFNYSNLYFCLEIKDDGVGFSEQIDLENSSLGMTLIHELSRQLHGDLSLMNDGGTKLNLKFQQKEQDES
jgi:two-component sensor histidine kinase